MFCRKCGKELNENLNYCPECGNKVYEEHDDTIIVTNISGFLIFNKMSSKKRKVFSKILKVFSKILLVFSVIIFLSTIYERANDEYNYKLIVDVIYIFNTVLPFLLLDFIVDEIYTLFKIEKSQIQPQYSKSKFLAVYAVYIILGFMGGLFLSNPTGAEKLNMLAVLSHDTFLGGLIEYIFIFKTAFIMLIFSGCVKYFIDEKMLKKTKNK